MRYMEVMGIPPILHEILCGGFGIPLLDCMIGMLYMYIGITIEYELFKLSFR